MTLLYPSLLWLLIPLAILWYYRPKKLTDTLHLLILALIVLALARPVADQEPIESEVEARDIIIALDLSYSMRARDISPNRYDYAKAVINQLLASNQTDNIMLIAFTTNPLLLSPPTTDHALISVALESLDPDNILTHGTSLKRVFEKIADLPMEEKNLILLSDGGEEKDLDMLKQIIRENGIHLTILALGTTAGTTIEKEDGNLLKDSEGNLVVSRINPLLERLAASSGGDYITASSDPNSAAEAIEESLENQATKETIVSKMQHNALELYPVPLLFALLLYLLLHTRAVKYLLPFAALWEPGSTPPSLIATISTRHTRRITQVTTIPQNAISKNSRPPRCRAKWPKRTPTISRSDTKKRCRFTAPSAALHPISSRDSTIISPTAMHKQKPTIKRGSTTVRRCNLETMRMHATIWNS
jgi:Ca-activated chloride channel family protein